MHSEALETGVRCLAFSIFTVGAIVILFVSFSDDGTKPSGLDRVWSMAKNGFTQIVAQSVAWATDRRVEGTLPNQTLSGFLYIEAPQLYTRERLVNDRFRQANWLSEELERTRIPRDELNFSSPSRVEREKQQSALMVQLGEGELRSNKAEEAEAGETKQPSELDQLKLLERRLNYRAALRNELMDTQLDDGHDLDGNTLYRLNFDAVSMPWADSYANPGSALFIVTARKPGSRHDGNKSKVAAIAKPSLTDDKPSLTDELNDDERQSLEDDLDLLRSWRREMQLFLTRVLTYRVDEFHRSGGLPKRTDPKEDVAFDVFLRVSLIEGFLNLLVDRVEMAFDCSEACDETTQAFMKIWNGKNKDKTMSWRRDHFAKWLGFAYRSDSKSPDILDSGLQESFRRSIRAATQVNNQRLRRGESEENYSHKCKVKFLNLSEEELTEELKKELKKMPVHASCAASLKDPQSLWAILRLISVVDALSGKIAPIAVSFDQRGINKGPKELEALMRTFERIVPSNEDITSRAKVWQGANGEEVLMRSSTEICQNKKDDIVQFGKCEFLNSKSSARAEEMIARFIAARLNGDLPAYATSERPIEKFLEVSLVGCRFTRCRFQIGERKSLTKDEAKVLGYELGEDGSTYIKSADITKSAMAESSSSSQRTKHEDVRSCATKVARYLTQQSLNYKGMMQEKYPDPVDYFFFESPAFETNLVHRQAIEYYSACMLGAWLERRRNDLIVYGVSPRLRGIVSAQSSDRRSELAANAASELSTSVSASIAHLSEQQFSETAVAPSVIGFSQVIRTPSPKNDSKGLATPKDETVFGWVVRSARSADGTWRANHHRLSAVVSVPSWWKRLEFEVTACWALPLRGRALGQTLLDDPQTACSDPSKDNDFENGIQKTSTLKRTFRISLPRRVEDVTARFDFDLIKTPYFDANLTEKFVKNSSPIKLEVGRKGRVVLSGERLWRGTVVTLGEQPADNIVVLPDMKGVIAEFDCVDAPPGEDYTRRYQALVKTKRSQSTKEPGAVKVNLREVETQSGSNSVLGLGGGGRMRSFNANITVWTSEGRTSGGVHAELHPFVQRTRDEKPCFARN